MAVCTGLPTQASEELCKRYSGHRLFIHENLERERLALERDARPRQRLKPAPQWANIPVIHLTHELWSSIDRDHLALYEGCAPHECLLGRHVHADKALQVPVFFIGNPNETYASLDARVHPVVFGRSSQVGISTEYETVKFHIRLGGGRFGKVRSTFRCGLPAIFVCSFECPQPFYDFVSDMMETVLVRGKLLVRQTSFDSLDTAAAEREAQRRREQEERRQRAEAEQRARANAAASQCRPPEGSRCPPPNPQQQPDRTPERPPERPAQQPPKQPPQQTDPVPQAESVQLTISATGNGAAGQNLRVKALPSCQDDAQQGYTVLTDGKAEVPLSRRAAAQSGQICLILERNTPLGRACKALPYTTSAVSAGLEDFKEENCTGLQRLRIVAKSEQGAAIAPSQILQAEENFKINGAAVQESEGMLVADLPIPAFREQVTRPNIASSFAQHTVKSQAFTDGALQIVLMPLYMRALDLTVKIEDGAGEAVRNCNLELDVLPARRLGNGWQKLASGNLSRPSPAALRLIWSGEIYRPDAPGAIAGESLLISLKDAGQAAALKSIDADCVLENRPQLLVEELRAPPVLRNLRKSGPVFIAMLSPDDGMADFLTRDKLEAYWTLALDLADAAAAANWERKLFARVQEPGVHPQTQVLRDKRQAESLFDGAAPKSRYLKPLLDDSMPQKGYPAVRLQSLGRENIDLALRILRKSAAIRAPESAGQESVLFIAGKVEGSESDLCRALVQLGPETRKRALWSQNVKSVLIVELWSERAVAIMQSAMLSEPVAAGLAGLHRCKIGGALGDKVKHYAISVTEGLDAGKREGVFNAMRELAVQVLRP